MFVHYMACTTDILDAVHATRPQPLARNPIFECKDEGTFNENLNEPCQHVNIRFVKVKGPRNDFAHQSRIETQS